MSNVEEENKDFVDGRVEVDVKIIRAEDLQGDKLNPYVTVNLGSNESTKKKTSVIKNEKNPVWDETFTFKVEDIETETLFINIYNKGLGLKDSTICKRVKISFLSFHYGETKDVEKELHNKDQYAGKIFLQVSLHEDPKHKAEAESKLCFSVLAIEGRDLEDDDYAVQLKMVADDNSNPITQTVHGTNPVWDEEIFIKTSEAKKDILKVVLLKNDKKCIESVKFNTADFQVGQQPITFDDDVYNKKKQKVGHLKFVVTPLDYNTDISKDQKYDLNVNLLDCKGYTEDDEPLTCDLQVNGKSVTTSKGSKNFKWNQSFVVPCNNLQKDVFTLKPSKGDGIAIMLNTLQLGERKEFNEEVPDIDDHYIRFTLLPAQHSRRTRSIRNHDCRDVILSDLSSECSTSFSSLPESAQQSLSDLRPSEEKLHHHDKFDASASNEESKPCRYDNVKGSITNLSGLIDPSNGDSDAKVYVTLDVYSFGLNLKKNFSKKSKKVAVGESPSLKFDLSSIKKGNSLVFNVWQQGSNSDPVNIGVVQIPVKEIPEGNDQSLTRDVTKPKNFTLGNYDSFGSATFNLSHDVEYAMPDEKKKKDDN